jgi:hypothetical protein
MKAHTVLTASLALALTACGGGGGGDDTPNQSAAGFWQGNGKDNRTVWGLAQANGTYWVMMSAPGDANTLAGAVQGHIDSIRGDTFESEQSTGLSWLAPQGSTWAFERFYATSKTTLWGSLNIANVVPYSLSYQSASEQTSTLAELAGNYTGRLVSTTNATRPTMVIDSTGTISGNPVDPNQASCTYSGSVTATSQASVFNLSETFDGNCTHPGTTTGALFFDKATHTVYAVALKRVGSQIVDGVRTFAFVGNPQVF